MDYFIRGKPVAEEVAAKWITKHSGGQVFTLAACEPDKMSKILIAQGKKVIRVTKENEDK